LCLDFQPLWIRTRSHRCFGMSSGDDRWHLPAKEFQREQEKWEWMWSGNKEMNRLLNSVVSHTSHLAFLDLCPPKLAFWKPKDPSLWTKPELRFEVIGYKAKLRRRKKRGGVVSSVPSWLSFCRFFWFFYFIELEMMECFLRTGCLIRRAKWSKCGTAMQLIQQQQTFFFFLELASLFQAIWLLKVGV